jgi:hypothetical protein
VGGGPSHAANTKKLVARLNRVSDVRRARDITPPTVAGVRAALVTCAIFIVSATGEDTTRLACNHH